MLYLIQDKVTGGYFTGSDKNILTWDPHKARIFKLKHAANNNISDAVTCMEIEKWNTSKLHGSVAYAKFKKDVKINPSWNFEVVTKRLV